MNIYSPEKMHRDTKKHFYATDGDFTKSYLYFPFLRRQYMLFQNKPDLEYTQFIKLPNMYRNIYLNKTI